MYIICLIRAPIGQGYGLTETCAGAAFTEADDTSVGRAGPPLPCCYIKVCQISTYFKENHFSFTNRMHIYEKRILWVIATEGKDYTDFTL